MFRYSFALALVAALAGPAHAASTVSAAAAGASLTPSEQYVASSELELEKLVGVMHEFMRDQKNMRKALAIMQADNTFQAVVTAGYASAKSSAGDNKELNLALDNYRQYQAELTHGGLGNADESDWPKMLAECKRLGELVKAAARTPVST